MILTLADVMRHGQEVKGSWGYEVGTCLNVQQVNEKYQPQIHWPSDFDKCFL